MSSNLPKEKNISSLYGELCRLIQSEEYERIIKQCNKILGLAPKELKAFHCKLVALINLDKIEECMNAINKQTDLSKDLYFERAYCEYRQNEPDKAMKTIEKAPEMTPGLLELKAQVLYKLERYEESYTLYRDIVKRALDDYDNERQTNISALLSFIPLPAGHSEPLTSTYEILYNTGYKQIMAGNLAEAEKTFIQCEKQCLQSCEDEGYSEEETEQEVAFIRLQLAYCYHKQGRTKAAHQIYSNLIRVKSDDAHIVAIASNNIAAINKDQNLFDSKKKMKLAVQEFNKNITSTQAKIVYINNCLLFFYLNQTDNCLKACDKIEELWPEDRATVTAIRAFVMHKDGKSDQAIEVLNKLVKQDPRNKLFLNLAIAQILLDTDRLKQACEILNNLGDDKYRPGIVGLRVSIYVALNDQPSAAKVFEETVDWYKKHQEAKGDVGSMWQQAVEFHMKHGNQKVAASCLEELLRSNQKDKRILAKLVIACVQFDPKKAEKYSQQLPSLDELTKNVKEEEIETMTFGSKVRSKLESSPGTPKTDGSEKSKRKKKKKKNKPPLPDGVYLDPERWLPKYERTGYKKKRDRRQKEQIKGSQGSATHNSEAFDFSGKTADKESDIDSPEVSRQSSSKRPPQQKKKKKGSRK